MSEAHMDDDTRETASEPSEARVRNLILGCGYGSAAMALIPIPGSATIGVAPIHIGMVVRLGQLYGAEITRDSAVKLVARIVAAGGASYVGGRIAMALGKLVVPVLPGLLGAPLIFANTLAIGAVARAHFQGKEELDDDAVRSLYTDALKRARKEFDPRKAKSAEAQAAAREASEAPEQTL